jgi:acyl carrier protein
MNDLEIKQIVAEVLSAVLHRHVEAGENLERAQAPEWDSLNHMEVVFSVEEKFDIRLSEEELASADSSSAICTLIRGHMGGPKVS